MLIEKRGMALRNAKAFPDAVAEHEARVEHRHDRLVALLDRAVDVDQDVAVARVFLRFVDALRHGLLLWGRSDKHTFKPVVPAKAGTWRLCSSSRRHWVPAFAGR
jgi:hypothetical protein